MPGFLRHLAVGGDLTRPKRGDHGPDPTLELRHRRMKVTKGECTTRPRGEALARRVGWRSVEGREAMEDQQVIDRINELAHEEHQLFEKESQGKATQAERERLKQLEVSLDQCWDLLHQRRARRNAGFDPDDARVRDEKTVEGYIG
jgi:hypothetical protein